VGRATPAAGAWSIEMSGVIKHGRGMPVEFLITGALNEKINLNIPLEMGNCPAHA